MLVIFVAQNFVVHFGDCLINCKLFKNVMYNLWIGSKKFLLSCEFEGVYGFDYSHHVCECGNTTGDRLGKDVFEKD